MEFERDCEKQIKEDWWTTCTPRGTSQIIGQKKSVFAIHRDFWGLLDGLGYRNGRMMGWQCKRDFLNWSPAKKKALRDELTTFSISSGISTRIYFKDGEIIGTEIINY
jgi:hypothetical protein